MSTEPHVCISLLPFPGEGDSSSHCEFYVLPETSRVSRYQSFHHWPDSKTTFDEQNQSLFYKKSKRKEREEMFMGEIKNLAGPQKNHPVL